MMTKQELEEKIAKGESVWYLFNKVYELETSEHTNKFISASDDYCYTDKKGNDRYCPLDMLYKSKSEAEHYLNHQDITRTETLPFLTWEEFKKGKDVFFYNNAGYWYQLYLEGSKIVLSVKGYLHSRWKATEENFYKAYDKCVRLFKGDR